jgi:hypothetical protein
MYGSRADGHQVFAWVREVAQLGGQHLPRLGRGRLAKRRFGILAVRAQAVLAGRHRVQHPDPQRHRRRRRRRRLLRHHLHRRLERYGRHRLVLGNHRGHLRARRNARARLFPAFATPALSGTSPAGPTAPARRPYLCTAGSGYNGTPFADTAFHTVGAKPATVVGTNGTTWVFIRTTSDTIETASSPSGSSTWSGLTSLGGTWPSYPGALATSDGSIWVFTIGGTLAGGDLYADHLPSGSSTWSGWTDIGNPGGGLIGTPEAVQDHSGTIHVFTRSASSGSVDDDELPSGSSTCSGFANLGGTFPTTSRPR